MEAQLKRNFAPQYNPCFSGRNLELKNKSKKEEGLL